jgi:hypothetical protein
LILLAKKENSSIDEDVDAESLSFITSVEIERHPSFLMSYFYILMQTFSDILKIFNCNTRVLGRKSMLLGSFAIFFTRRFH